jgi:hypothetical protein
MKDSKSLLLLVVSVLLILVSFALLWSWGYNLGNQKSEKQGTVYIIKDSTAAANATRDSLNRIYANTIENISILDSTWNRADSLKQDLDVKLTDFYKLRNEIAELLKNPSTKADLEIAKQKIGELQKKVDQLRDRNAEIERENKRLYGVLAQLTADQKQALQNYRATTTASSSDNRTIPVQQDRPAPVGSVFTASDLRLSAMMVDEGKEQETYQALQTDKFVGSFVVRNNLSQTSNAEIMVVLVQPDGKVVKSSAWESGSFETPEGRRIYSCKVRFEYSKGESKRLSFTVNADKCVKGNYTVQLYQNGIMIAKSSKTLI